MKLIALGLLLAICGAILALLGWLVIIALPNFLDSQALLVGPIVVLVLLSVVTVGALQLFRWGLQIARARSAQWTIDAKEFTLLGVSFLDDALVLQPTSLLSRFYKANARLEEVAGRQLHFFGALIAVGKPAEKLPPLGAFRVYLQEDEWQETVVKWLGQARSIVMVVGLTPWVSWELASIRELGVVSKLFALMPPGSNSFRLERWENYLRAWIIHLGEMKFGRYHSTECWRYRLVMTASLHQSQARHRES